MIPTGLHSDWPLFLKYVPRRWTAFESEIDPVQLYGNVPAGHHLDIPGPGEWCIADAAGKGRPAYLAVRLRMPIGTGSIYFRVGTRRDYNDKYYERGAFTLKYYKE